MRSPTGSGVSPRCCNKKIRGLTPPAHLLLLGLFLVLQIFERRFEDDGPVRDHSFLRLNQLERIAFFRIAGLREYPYPALQRRITFTRFIVNTGVLGSACTNTTLSAPSSTRPCSESPRRRPAAEWEWSP